MGTPTINEVLTAYDEKVVAGVRACIDLNESVILIGETGTGKTTLINELAKEKGRELIRVSLNRATSTDDILGKYQAKDGSTYWQNGVLVNAMLNGHWIVFDEVNACLPEVLFALHSLLDDDRKVTLTEKDGSIIRPTSEFRFFACMNPSEDYAGTKEMNMALMSRFAGVFYIDIFPTDKEIKVLERNKVGSDDAKKLANLAFQLREKRKNGDINTFVSTRDIIQAGKLASAGVPFEQAVVFSVFNKLTTDEREDLSKTAIFKAFTTERLKSEEEKKLEASLKKTSDDLKQYKEAYEKQNKQLVETQKELAEMKAHPLGEAKIDAKTEQLLKTLGIIK